MSETNPSFEELLSELTGIVQELEHGRVSLEESLARFERGVAILRECRGRLDACDARINELIEIDEHGHARLRPFEHEASASAKPREGEIEPPSKKSRRKGSTKDVKEDPPSSSRDDDLFG